MNYLLLTVALLLVSADWSKEFQVRVGIGTRDLPSRDGIVKFFSGPASLNCVGLLLIPVESSFSTFEADTDARVSSTFPAAAIIGMDSEAWG